MDESDCHAWWHLHVRVAKGETLIADKLAAYEAGLHRLDAEEADTLAADDKINPLRDLRERILAADVEHQRLSQRFETMCAEMARLEALLDDRTQLTASSLSERNSISPLYGSSGG